MARYTAVSGGFDIGSDSYVDKRLLLTKEEMKAAYDEWFMPPVYIAYCLDDKQWYEYNEENDEDPETGFYRPIPAGIVKDVRIEGDSIVDSEGIADFEFPLEDVLVDGESVVENKKAQIDLSDYQKKLIPGENISISDSNVISAQSTPPLEGNGIKVDSEGHISIDPEVVPEKDTLPQDVADIADELGLITISALVNYYTNSETYNKEEINQLISTIAGGITLEVVAVLPITGDSDKIYLVRRSIDSNIYDQYVWFNSTWVQVGSTEVDLSQYYTKDEVDSLLEDKQNELTAGQGIRINHDTISVDTSDLPSATASTPGLVKIDNITIKKNDDGQLYSVGGGSGGGDYYEGNNIYFTTQSGKTYINAEGYEAGDGINISNSNRISAKVDDETVHINRYGEIYMDAIAVDAGDGITIRDGVITVDRTTVPTEAELALKQDKLVAGTNIVIAGNVISAVGGGGGGSGANWGEIGGTLSNQVDLQYALNQKAPINAIPTAVSQLTNDVPYATASQVANKQDKLIAGANITISPDNVISATGSSGPTEVNWGGIRGDITDQVDLISYINSHMPTVSNASIMIKKNGTSVGGFSLNQSASGEVNITVPTFSLSGTVLTITNN